MKLLERLGHRHTELTNIFDALVKQQTEPDAPADGEGDKKEGDAPKDDGKGQDGGKPKEGGDKR